MKTLLIALTITWFIISTFKIYKDCKEIGVKFNPFYVKNILYFIGFMLVGMLLIGLVISLTIEYLP